MDLTPEAISGCDPFGIGDTEIYSCRLQPVSLRSATNANKDGMPQLLSSSLKLAVAAALALLEKMLSDDPD